MKIPYIWEHNGSDSLVYAESYIGAYARGRSLQEALAKMEREITSYAKWCNMEIPSSMTLELSMDKASDLQICDADSDVIFDSEKSPLTEAEYEFLKQLALKSAEDFLHLYHAIPDKNKSVRPQRSTFYGAVPRTAFEMYEHTKNVNQYYFAEINVDVDNCGDILQCRKRGFALVEEQEDFLSNKVFPVS